MQYYFLNQIDNGAHASKDSIAHAFVTRSGTSKQGGRKFLVYNEQRAQRKNLCALPEARAWVHKEEVTVPLPGRHVIAGHMDHTPMPLATPVG